MKLKTFPELEKRSGIRGIHPDPGEEIGDSFRAG